MAREQNSITVLDVLREIHQQASGLVSLETLGQKGVWRLNSLRGAVSVLIEVAKRLDDSAY